MLELEPEAYIQNRLCRYAMRVPEMITRTLDDDGGEALEQALESAVSGIIPGLDQGLDALIRDGFDPDSDE
jgi:hypothetical protein